MRKIYFLLFIFVFFLLLSCASLRLEKSLSPAHKEFLSKVRYIITSEERKAFLNLPPSERDKFIEEFWKKRDPDPTTEVNEFKEQYFARIEEAKKLFRGEGVEGWLTERGRIYILLGPPEQRETDPTGQTLYGRPTSTEIWSYESFQIVFIDYYWSGIYKLESFSAQLITEINRAQTQSQGKPRSTSEKAGFDFTLKIGKGQETETLIQIEIPYKDIWLKEEDNQLKTTLNVMIEISDSSGKKLNEIQKSYPLTLERERLKDFFGKSYLIEIPVNLQSGNYALAVELENKTDESRVKKRENFTIRENLNLTPKKLISSGAKNN
jgi:GWxTD domain-containing protein